MEQLRRLVQAYALPSAEVAGYAARNTCIGRVRTAIEVPLRHMYTDERCTTEPTESRRNFDSGFKALRTGLMEALKRINKEETK